MTILSLVVFALVVWLAFWIIDQAFPVPVKVVAKVVVGVLALLYLLDAFHVLPGLR